MAGLSNHVAIPPVPVHDADLNYSPDPGNNRSKEQWADGNGKLSYSALVIACIKIVSSENPQKDPEQDEGHTILGNVGQGSRIRSVGPRRRISKAWRRNGRR